ncbi:MAG TPA: hypothetical protein VGR53_06935 [Nitrososphaerales archaeon]|nr:hypothetical protein [Nitrososphaerales archaeon]
MEKKMMIWVATEVSEELHKEFKKISTQTGKKLTFLYREALQDFAEKNKVIVVEQQPA